MLNILKVIIAIHLKTNEELDGLKKNIVLSNFTFSEAKMKVLLCCTRSKCKKKRISKAFTFSHVMFS